MQVNYPCPRCGSPSPGGLSYFALPIPTVGDLIGELNPLPELDSPNPSAKLPIPDGHKFALLVFFCTLAEVLLQHFLQRHMDSLTIPLPVQRRLLSDNSGVKRRLDNLFPSIVGVKWKDAVKTVSANSGKDFSQTVAFAAEAAAKRNLLVHLGNQWAIPQAMTERCFNETSPLVRLFVELHNAFLARPVNAPNPPNSSIPDA